MQIDWSDVDPAQLPGDLKEIACDCGLDVARYLVEMWGGAMIYVPTLHKLRKEHRTRLIIGEYDGQNGGTLAAKLGVSRRYVMQVIKENKPAAYEGDEAGEEGGGDTATDSSSPS